MSSATFSPASLSARIEAGVLLAFAFVVPLFEAPKNLLWLALVVVWLANRWRSRDFGGRWDRWDTLIAAWIVSGFASAAFAGLHHDEWRAAADIVRYGGVLWLLKRSRYADRTWLALLAAILAGTLVGLAWGYAVLEQNALELKLNSVGHVNHSAIYLAIVCGAGLAMVRAYWSRWSWGLRTGGAALLAALAISLVWMQSRGAVGAAFIAALVVLAAYDLRHRRHMGRTALIAAIAIGVALALKPAVLEKNVRFFEKGEILNARDAVWRVAISAWREFPLFGVGMDNFGRIRKEDLAAWSAKRGETFDAGAYFPNSHAHNLYFNTLAERGLVGLGALLAVLAAWAWSLARAVPEGAAPPLRWTYWGAAAGALVVTALAGAVNTTLHHEHALVAMLLLGGWLGLSRSP